MVAAAVRTLKEALQSPQAKARDMVISMDTPAGPLRGVGLPIKFNGHAPDYRPPPKLGEHTAEVLDALPD